MKTEKKIKLFAKLKEEFESATDFGDYSIEYEFEINNDYDNETDLVCDVTIKLNEEKKIYLLLRIDEKYKTEVNTYEDEWIEWVSYDFQVSNLWRKLMFECY